MLQPLYKILLSVCLCITLAACYHIPAQQGNLITASSLQKLHTGMTTTEVTKALGWPVLNDIYHDNYISYTYSYRGKLASFEKRFLVIYFYRGHVTSWRTNLTKKAAHAKAATPPPHPLPNP